MLLIALIMSAVIERIALSFEGIVELHSKIPIFWVLDVSPILLAVVGNFIFMRIVKNQQKLVAALEDEKDKSYKVLEFTERLRRGEFQTAYEFLNKKDELGKSLTQLRDDLKKNKADEEQRRKEDDQRHWATEGLAKFGEILREHNNDMSTLAYNIISQLVRYLNVIQGGFFILRDDDKENLFFELIAQHAYDRKKFCNKTVQWGEGLIGACALEKKTIFIDEVSEAFVEITSGLGKANPRCILIVPLKIMKKYMVYWKLHHSKFTNSSKLNLLK